MMLYSLCKRARVVQTTHVDTEQTRDLLARLRILKAISEQRGGGFAAFRISWQQNRRPRQAASSAHASEPQASLPVSDEKNWAA